ncbi:MAG: hypothetical protein ACJ70T_06245, partial [Nitrososphaera sp.]
ERPSHIYALNIAIEILSARYSITYQREITYSKRRIQNDESAKHLKKDITSEYQMIRLSLLVMFKQLNCIPIFWVTERDHSHL